MTNPRLRCLAEDIALYQSAQPDVSEVYLFDEETLSDNLPQIYLAATVPLHTFEAFVSQLETQPRATTELGISTRRTRAAISALHCDRSTFDRIAGDAQVNLFLFFPGWQSQLNKLDQRLSQFDTFIALNIGPVRWFNPATTNFAPAA